MCRDLVILATGQSLDCDLSPPRRPSSFGTENALMESVVAKTKANLPWWLESGSEICPACSHTYVYETEYRCVACDGPLCPICVEYTTALEIYCPTTDCAHAQIEE